MPIIAATVLAVLVAAVGYGGFLAWRATSEFEGRRWDLPAKVYAAPMELYVGRPLELDDFVAELRRLGFRADRALATPGTYRVRGATVELATRGFDYAGEKEPSRRLAVAFAGGRIARLADAAGADLAIARLDPLLIGSIFPAHGEDRLIVTPDEVPPLLIGALKAVEDRRFDTHFGIDLKAVLRAAWVNLTSGEIRQGASTLTQQLVRSYFLSNERSWWRKLREAFMAVALEVRYDKDDLLHAYINEIYLAQDGGRAVHGFGLASQFYFGKPLPELELSELALLVAQVRGPTFYDPRRHPQRALDRRNLVLEQMAAAGLITEEQRAAAAEEPLGIVAKEDGRRSTHSAFLDLVRRQLVNDYPADVLEREGLTVWSTLDPAVQAAAERALAEGLDALGDGGAGLEGAVIVTTPHNGEVRAVVGGRDPSFAGFNRALDARRQIGSLIKPVVYLAALESGKLSLASVVEDAPIDVELEDGRVWSPRNFDDETHGPVTLVRALAESLNLATVRVGLEVGLDAVANTLGRLGLPRRPPLYPSLLLGSIELTPFEVAQIYNTLANGGFRVPLNAVRAVVDAQGEVLKRYPLEIEQAADADAVYTLNHALVQVMQRGTGRRAQALLPEGMTTAGKTGTSDGYRDSWFAGFTDRHLVVTWVGADDNRPTGLTGSTGAARIWARTLASLGGPGYSPPELPDLPSRWIDYYTGLRTRERCPNAVLLPVPDDARPPRAFGCGDDEGGFGARMRRWLRNDR
ncbi:MAG TPA: penicillin-binding protein 1B [Gammaproteobacteria bacterium]